MIKIDLLYIKESRRIIDTYDELITYVNNIYDVLSENKTILLNIKDQLTDIENNDTDTQIKKMSDLNNTILEYEKEVVKLQNDLEPYLSKIEQIKKDSTLLYKTIKENYPGIPDNKLQEQIFKQIEELKKRES